MNPPYSSHLPTLLPAIQTAASISRTVLSSLSSSHNNNNILSTIKSDHSPVTVADLAIQAVLLSVIHSVFPSHRLVAEESADQLRSDPALLKVVQGLALEACADNEYVWDHGGRELKDADKILDILDASAGEIGDSEGLTWVVDPIDGTQAFLRGEQYAINVALLERGKQVLSVVACPLLAVDAAAPLSDGDVDPAGKGCIVFGVRGHGAYVRPLEGDHDKVEVRKLERHAEVVAEGGLLSVTSFGKLESGFDEINQEVAKRLGMEFPGCNLLGWVPRWTALALGLANTTFWVYKKRERYGKIWDHAGAMLLFEEAGGKITDVDGKDIDLTRGRLLDGNFGFVAAPKNMHPQVLATVRDVLKDLGKGHLLA